MDILASLFSQKIQTIHLALNLLLLFFFSLLLLTDLWKLFHRGYLEMPSSPSLTSYKRNHLALTAHPGVPLSESHFCVLLPLQCMTCF